MHNVIVVAVPVAFLSAVCAWAGIDNALIYPKERQGRHRCPERPRLSKTPTASTAIELAALHSAPKPTSQGPHTLVDLPARQVR